MLYKVHLVLPNQASLLNVRSIDKRTEVDSMDKNLFARIIFLRTYENHIKEKKRDRDHIVQC